MTKAGKADEGNDHNGHDSDVEAFCSVSKCRGDSEFIDGDIGWCLDLVDLLFRTAPVDIGKAGEKPSRTILRPIAVNRALAVPTIKYRHHEPLLRAL